MQIIYTFEGAMIIMNLVKCDTGRPYAFISYARVNQDRVRSDVSELQARGCNVWLDSENMVGGKPVEQTDDIIRDPNCKALIFYMCEKSVCSEYCLAELRVAKKYNIPIIPIHCFPVSGLEETIIGLQRYMKSKEQVEISDRLIADILKTKNGSEMISIPYDTPTHLNEIIKSLEGNGAGGVITETAAPVTIAGESAPVSSVAIDKPSPVINTEPTAQPTAMIVIENTKPVVETVQESKPVLFEFNEAAVENQPTVDYIAETDAEIELKPIEVQPDTSKSPAKKRVLKKPLIFAIAGVLSLALIIGVISIISYNTPKEVISKRYHYSFQGFGKNDMYLNAEYTGTWQKGKPNGKGTLVTIIKDKEGYFATQQGEFADGNLFDGTETRYNDTITIKIEGYIHSPEYKQRLNGTITTYDHDVIIKKEEGQCMNNALVDGTRIFYDNKGIKIKTEEGRFKDGELFNGTVTDYENGAYYIKDGKIVEN